MKRDFFKLSLFLFLAVAVLYDAGYLAFLGIQINNIQAGTAILHAAFRPLSIAAAVLNAALALYTAIYLIFRKR